MQCFVYRSRKQPDMYVYLPQKDEFLAIPEALTNKLGVLEFSLSFDLHPEKKLAKENAQDVINNINHQGFHLQMPDQLETVTALDTRLN